MSSGNGGETVYSIRFNVCLMSLLYVSDWCMRSFHFLRLPPVCLSTTCTIQYNDGYDKNSYNLPFIGVFLVSLKHDTEETYHQIPRKTKQETICFMGCGLCLRTGRVIRSSLFWKGGKVGKEKKQNSSLTVTLEFALVAWPKFDTHKVVSKPPQFLWRLTLEVLYVTWFE